MLRFHAKHIKKGFYLEILVISSKKFVKFLFVYIYFVKRRYLQAKLWPFEVGQIFLVAVLCNRYTVICSYEHLFITYFHYKKLQKINVKYVELFLLVVLVIWKLCVAWGLGV